MKTSEAQKIATTKLCLLSALMLVFFCYVLPFGNLAARSVGPAILFTATFCFYPDIFRSRSGSLVPAFYMTAFVWLCAAVPILLSLFGGH